MAQWGLERIAKIYVDDDLRDRPIVERARNLFAHAEMQFVKPENMNRETARLSSEDFDRSKTELYLTSHKGRFFKRCPGARPGLQCCNYFVLNLGLQCNMNCSYCYLQSFINSPVMKVYVNVEEAVKELRHMANDMAEMPVRVGTGEVIDSLSLDPLTLFSRDLIAFFKDYPKWRLEFKTKSKNIEQFIDCEHAGNVIVSFSINPQNVIEHEEHGTATLTERLDAARLCRDRGYLVSFHIDPMIWHPNWRDSYRELVKEVCDRFTPEDMPYMSVGALRFQPDQRHMMRERFAAGSWITGAEMFPSSDGKLRYDQSLREEMFSHVIGEFKKRSPKWNIFLCMETPDTWLASVGELPKRVEGLGELFDASPVVKARRLQSEML